MDISFNRQQFATAFAISQMAVPSRTALPILKNVKLVVGKDSSELIATDQEIAVRVQLEGVEVKEGGEILLPTARLSAIMRELSDEKLALRTKGDKVVIEAKAGRFNLLTEPPEEFPPVPRFSNTEFYKIPAVVLRNMIRRTVFATESESTRYAIGGVKVEFEKKGREQKVAFIATDARRLAIATAACERVGEVVVDQGGCIVPTKALHLIEKAIDPQTEFAEIAIDDKSILVRSGRVTVFSRLVEGRFPKYRNVIPPLGVQIPVVAGLFFSAVRQAMIVTDEENSGVEFCFGNNELVLSSKASTGDSSVTLPIEFDEELERKITVRFTPKYIADFLKILDQTSLVEIGLVDGDTAATFKVDDYLYLIMPMTNDR